jgi:hypothetical protein
MWSRPRRAPLLASLLCLLPAAACASADRPLPQASTVSQPVPSSVEPASETPPSSPESSPAASVSPSPEPSQPSPTSPEAAASAGSVELVIGGDVNLGGTLGRIIAARGSAYPWSRVASHLQKADIALVNLECSASLEGSGATKEFTFQADPVSLPAMAAAGVDLVSVANNHSLDFGPAALVDAVGNLSRAGITAIGGGSNDAEAWRPEVRQVKGLRLAFIGVSKVVPPGWAATSNTPGVASAYQTKRLLQAVRQARAGADIVVVMLHWGVEGSTEPNPDQVSLAHALVDAGARIVVGAHPHVTQPVVRYRDGVIAYSLGNLVFTSKSVVQDTFLLKVTISPAGEIRFATIPLKIVGGQPRDPSG